MRTRAEQLAAIQADQQLWRGLAVEVGPDRYGELEGPLVDVDFTGHLHDEHLQSVRTWLHA